MPNCQLLGKVVGGDARGHFGRRLEPAEDQAIEILVIALHPHRHAGIQALLDGRQRLPGALAANRETAVVGEVDEVVRLQQLLVARTLREQAAGHAHARPVGHVEQCGEPW